MSFGMVPSNIVVDEGPGPPQGDLGVGTPSRSDAAYRQTTMALVCGWSVSLPAEMEPCLRVTGQRVTGSAIWVRFGSRVKVLTRLFDPDSCSTL